MTRPIVIFTTEEFDAEGERLGLTVVYEQDEAEYLDRIEGLTETQARDLAEERGVPFSTGRWHVQAFDVDNERLADKRDLPTITVGVLRTMFGRPENDPMNLAEPVNHHTADQLAPYMEEELQYDFGKHRYYVQAYAEK